MLRVVHILRGVVHVRVWILTVRIVIARRGGVAVWRLRQGHREAGVGRERR